LDLFVRVVTVLLRSTVLLKRVKSVWIVRAQISINHRRIVRRILNLKHV